MSYGLVSYGPTVLSYGPRVLCPMVLLSYALWSYCLMSYADIKPGLHSMQKAQFNAKRKIGVISFLSIKINVTLCMLSVKDPRGYGHQHTSLATVVFNLVPEVVP